MSLPRQRRKARRGDAGPFRPIPNDRVEIRSDPVRGRGLFARERIAAGSVIERAPVIILPAHECSAIDRTVLHDYYFHWQGDPDGEGGTGALALGLLSLCNHARPSKARVHRNYAERTLDLVALVPIEPDEEITIDYGPPLWFEPAE